MKLLNETVIGSFTLSPVIRRQVNAHAGPGACEALIVRVHHGRRCTQITGRAWLSRGAITIVIPVIRTVDEWRKQAPRLAQVTAILAARFSRRHARLMLRPKFKAPPETVVEFAVAADIPFVASMPSRRMLSLEARLEWVILERRRTQTKFEKARARYQRWRKYEKVLRFRLRRMGSQAL